MTDGRHYCVTRRRADATASQKRIIFEVHRNLDCRALKRANPKGAGNAEAPRELNRCCWLPPYPESQWQTDDDFRAVMRESWQPFSLVLYWLHVVAYVSRQAIKRAFIHPCQPIVAKHSSADAHSSVTPASHTFRAIPVASIAYAKNQIPPQF
jgi:hypothetical protein